MDEMTLRYPYGGGRYQVDLTGYYDFDKREAVISAVYFDGALVDDKRAAAYIKARGQKLNAYFRSAYFSTDNSARAARVQAYRATAEDLRTRGYPVRTKFPGYAVIDTFKARGGHWSPADKTWYFADAETAREMEILGKEGARFLRETGG
jgi:hypothetical protein